MSIHKQKALLALSVSYNNLNSELTESSAPGTSVSYSYDPKGNVASKSVTGGGTVTWTYSWDVPGDLLKVTGSTGLSLYAYDGMGRNIEAVESGSINYHAYQGTNVLFKNIHNSDKWAYVYIAGLRVSMVIDDTSRYYFHDDALGSTRMMTWQDAGMVYVDSYQPFGQDNGRPSGSFTSRAIDKFTGKPVSQRNPASP
jgi:YD repeat-containing protein